MAEERRACRIPGYTAERVARWMPSLKLAFWLLLALFILLALVYGLRGEQRKTIGKSYRILCSLIVLLFAGILAYQATWQLAGFARPEFVKFQRHYNRRPDHPAARIVRGPFSNEPCPMDFRPAGKSMAGNLSR